MDSQIEVWRVKQFEENVYHLSQQEGSMLSPYVRHESFVGKADFFDRLGESSAIDKTDRNGDTPNLNIDHTRRMLTTVTRHWGTLVDRKDKLQQIHMPENEYAKSAMYSLGRKFDNVLISAAFGSAIGGEEGDTSVVLPNAQKITSVASSAIAVPNIQLLRKAKRKFDENKVKGERYIVYAADFLEGLLADTQVISSDYNSVKALVQGELDTYMGFKFIHCEEIDSFLATTYDLDSPAYKYNTSTGLYDSSGTVIGATDKVALAFSKEGLIFGENTNGRMAKIEPRPDKSYSMQVYCAQDMGAVRMEEACVVQLIYKDA